jgi:hypothetical protein
MNNDLSENIVIHSDAKSFIPFDWPARWVWTVEIGEVEADSDHPPDFTPKGRWVYHPSGAEVARDQWRLVLKIMTDQIHDGRMPD